MDIKFQHLKFKFFFHSRFSTVNHTHTVESLKGELEKEGNLLFFAKFRRRKNQIFESKIMIQKLDFF